MVHGRRLWLLALAAVLYGAVFLAMEHNLTVQTAALAAAPVTVVVDAGHGGEDGGAVSRSGVRESEINLQVARRLEQVLAFCGITPKMLRSGDGAVTEAGDTVQERKRADLKERVRLVEETEPAILVSIHQNHFAEEKYDGAQVFYAASTGSRELAELLQSSLRHSLDPGNRRQCKPADTVYLLEQVSCTAVLVECGFLSNPRETLLLQDPVYQTKIACALACGLAQFLEEGKDVENKNHFLLHCLRQ